ncbi:hypothetical protein [Zwartia sp.]|uniref:hypothetical protein n=1 Tax=Zwartia sp. TaxID=2978004 RepID=UPI003BAECBB9
MKSFFSTFVAILLSCQLSLATAFESFNYASNEVHQAFSHDQSIDHHHHDAFATHFDHGGGDAAHQHVTDHFQSSALVPDSDALPPTSIVELLIAFNPQEPPSVFLDGLLRPPRKLV